MDRLLSMLYSKLEDLQIHDNVRQIEEVKGGLKCKHELFDIYNSSRIVDNVPTRKVFDSRGDNRVPTTKRKMADECAKKKKVCTTAAAPHKTWDIHHSNQPSEVSSQAQHTAKRKLEEGAEEKKRVKTDTLRRWPRHEF